uniref:Si:ch211-263p13.7 n=2 Tax=Eptatretus burgeri TaxID=7764 RepID=A0A8C4R8R3_EPTBU
MKKHSARVAPLSACSTPVLSLTRADDSGMVVGESRETDNNGNLSLKGDELESNVSCATSWHRTLWAFVLLPGVSASWLGVSELGQSPGSDIKPPPAFLTAWLATSANLLVFPLYHGAAGVVAVSRGSQWPGIIQQYREGSQLFGEHGLVAGSVLRCVAPLTLLWTLTAYLYLLALHRLAIPDAAALFCCNKAFVFLLSWVLLRDRFMGIRIIAVILAISGIVMMAYGDGLHNDSIVGTALAVGSASVSAFYKVLFRLLLGGARFGEAALFLSLLGVLGLVVGAAIAVAMCLGGAERWPPPSLVPWARLIGTAALLVAFNLLVNFGVALTFPAAISLGMLFSVPVTNVLEACRSGVHNIVRLVAAGTICIAFLLLLLPEGWDDKAWALMDKVRARWRSASETCEEGSETKPQAMGDVTASAFH